ncbi:FadR/GntR family transcriptional regulator [Rhabdothermincola salaria]|uniref:FadR/GntR family transcriptional regulator n=1 Tax=Rhabdothermincola salaria TaxID=2903142 RepID=UPI001E2ED6A5|nr:GntR family transcriptional regulator [Rhabdothermincola salaria]MCD9622960.1 GntR family transcriptional regulator [Rhabdothermincola salaria]
METRPSPRARLRRRSSPAEIVADELRERILSGTVPDGGELPKLDQLIEEFGVSRATARQACQILETEGLIQVRRGNVGGSSVRVPRPANVAYTLGQVLEARRVTVGDVAAAVEHFEPLCAELCAERRDRRREVLPALDTAQDDLMACIEAGDGHGASLAARRWHEALVDRCGNDTATVLLGTLESVWGAHARATSAELDAAGVPLSDELSRRVHAEHDEIRRLVAEGDGPGAAAAARAHLRTAQIHPTDRRDGNVVDALTIRDELLG